jgi:tRNA threonylcarbamoyl adenosine modification protein (Sua5/YciO/YrdC/YwlC family)
MAKIKGVKMEQANFSLICYDLSHLSSYAKPLDTSVFKLMKRSLPGPYTFILPASKSVPRLFTSKKKTIGIRVPDNDIARSIVLKLGNPMVSTSIHDDDDVLEYTTDPELIHERYKDKVDMVISSGYGNNIASTVFDCTGEEPVVIRQGAGETEGLI